LKKVDKDIKEITEIDYSDLHMESVAIDEADGSVVTLLSEGTIYGTGVLRFNPKDGRVIQIVEGVGGCSLDINPKDRTIWIVGKNIYKLKKDCETLFSLEDVIGWCAVDVSVDPNDGSAWVVERKHPQVLGSQNRLIKVSESGEILKVIDMQETTAVHEVTAERSERQDEVGRCFLHAFVLAQYDPFSVSVDAKDGAVWVASKQILKFDRDGNLLKALENGGFCIRVNPKDNSCWVAGRSGVFKYSASGDLLASNTNFSDDQKWIAVI
jgi:hypothetical protein